MEFDFILNAYVQWRKLQMNILLFIAGKFIFLWVKLTRSLKKKINKRCQRKKSVKFR